MPHQNSGVIFTNRKKILKCTWRHKDIETAQRTQSTHAITCPVICVALLTVGTDATSLGVQQQKKCSLSTQWTTFNHDDVCVTGKVEVTLPRGTKGTGERGAQEKGHERTVATYCRC